MIWTRVAVSISCNNKHYTTGTSYFFNAKERGILVQSLGNSPRPTAKFHLLVTTDLYKQVPDWIGALFQEHRRNQAFIDITIIDVGQHGSLNCLILRHYWVSDRPHDERRYIRAEIHSCDPWIAQSERATMISPCPLLMLQIFYQQSKTTQFRQKIIYRFPRAKLSRFEFIKCIEWIRRVCRDENPLISYCIYFLLFTELPVLG